VGAGLVLALALLWVTPLGAAEIRVELEPAPEGGEVVLLLFDSANAFGDLRDAVRRVGFPADGRSSFELVEVPAGAYALVVHHDRDGNGVIDKNFIGIPSEPLAFSNAYRPKGPPSYQRARFEIGAGERRVMQLELYQPLGRRGRLGVGVGVIGRSSPYRDDDETVAQFIPAVTYTGERFQILGPNLQVGLVGSGRVRLAATATYRIGVYEEDDSPFLAGMGDRDSTLLAGLGLELELPRGFDLELRAEADVLDRIGGAAASLGLEKSWQLGLVRLTPRVAVSWQSADLADHDFGVAPEQATPERPIYRVDDTFTVEAGVGSLIEVTRDWLIVLELAVERFDDEVTGSPIVTEQHVIKGFFALNYVF
jgi:outer membrane protein